MKSCDTCRVSAGLPRWRSGPERAARAGCGAGSDHQRHRDAAPQGPPAGKGCPERGPRACGRSCHPAPDRPRPGHDPPAPAAGAPVPAPGNPRRRAITFCHHPLHSSRQLPRIRAIPAIWRLCLRNPPSRHCRVAAQPASSSRRASSRANGCAVENGLQLRPHRTGCNEHCRPRISRFSAAGKIRTALEGDTDDAT